MMQGTTRVAVLYKRSMLQHITHRDPPGNNLWTGVLAFAALKLVIVDESNQASVALTSLPPLVRAFVDPYRLAIVHSDQ